MAIIEKGRAYRFKQGQGLIDQKPVSVISAGDYRYLQIIIGKPNFFQNLLGKQDKVYTGFDPGLADWEQGTSTHLLALDYDTDIQVDIRKIWREKEAGIDQILMRKKLMAGSMLKAQEKTRQIREQKSFLEKYKDMITFFFVLLFGFLIFYFGFTTHNPKNINIQVSSSPSTGLYVLGYNTTSNVSGGSGLANSIINQAKNIGNTVSSAYHDSQHIP